MAKDRFTPQQIQFGLNYYLPSSPTFSNAYRSAIKAGYAEGSAKNITDKELKWLKDIVLEITGEPTDKKSLVAKAKKVLDRSLDASDLRLAQDTAKFIAKTDKEFTELHDVTSNGEALPPIALVKFPKVVDDGTTDTSN